MVLRGPESARLDLAIRCKPVGEHIPIGSQEGLARGVPLGIASSQSSCLRVKSSVGLKTAEVISNACIASDFANLASEVWASLNAFLRFSPRDEQPLERAFS